jgi:hypothetical protein
MDFSELTRRSIASLIIEGRRDRDLSASQRNEGCISQQYQRWIGASLSITKEAKGVSLALRKKERRRGASFSNAKEERGAKRCNSQHYRQREVYPPHTVPGRKNDYQHY